ncbi:MAG: hypothetical protein R6V04_07820, partial [bacterium]
MSNLQKNMRILFLPQEIGNQMQLMAESLRSKGHFATTMAYSQDRFGTVNDIIIDISRYPNRMKRYLNISGFLYWA